MRTHTRTYTRTHTRTYTRTHTRTYTRTCTRTYTRTYTRTHTRTHTRTYTRTHTRTYARTCRFVGMLPQDQLQQFIVRAVTGHGERVQGDVNDAMLKVLTFAFYVLLFIVYRYRCFLSIIIFLLHIWAVYLLLFVL